MNASVEQVVSALDTISLNDRSVVASVIKIQSIIRMYLVMRNILIPNAKYQTKLWRKARSWYRTGKHNECEKYQLSMIRSITSISLLQTYDRINLESLDIVECKYPMKEIDGFEYTEDFDGLHIMDGKHLYFNLKFVCDRGGAQTRSLREVYHFMKAQLNHLLAKNCDNIYFINILDGDTCDASFSKYQYLIDQPRFTEIKKYMFVGDLAMFQIYWRSRSI